MIGNDGEISPWIAQFLQYILIKRGALPDAIEIWKKRMDQASKKPPPLPDDEYSFIPQGFNIAEFDKLHLSFFSNCSIISTIPDQEIYRSVSV